MDAALVKLLRFSPALGFSGPWHLKQYVSRSGRTSASKDGGEAPSTSNVAEVTIEPAARRKKNIVLLNLGNTGHRLDEKPKIFLQKAEFARRPEQFFVKNAMM